MPGDGAFSVREAQLDRRDLALLMMSELADTSGERFPLDRIRLQKAIFLLTRRGSADWRTLYNYKPYNWGPYSSQLTFDLGELMGEGLLDVQDATGSRYGRYRDTAEGEACAREIWATLTDSEQAFIRSVRAYVTDRSFTELLREVYAEYPEFATASQFSG
jgi:uncharacterized protein YwgA